ncbi:MAG: VWA domain-containing protein [Caldilineaceae bacterium]
MRKRSLTLFLITVLLINILQMMFSGQVSAKPHEGEGKYKDGNPDTIDLSVLFMFDTTPDFNPNSAWEGTFTRASELLYNATDGQVQLGEIALYNNCPFMMDKADILVHPGAGRASAHPAGLGNPGWHTFLYNDTNSQNISSDRGHVTVVHELGHYVFELYDEYRDIAGNEFQDAKGNPIACVLGSSDASLMDAGGSYNNQRTEFALYSTELTACSNTEHVQKTKQIMQTPQGIIDWPWIKYTVQKKYGANLSMPKVRNTTMPPGHTVPNFKYYDCSVRAVVTLDRSGSMTGAKLATAKQGAQNFIDLASGNNSSTAAPVVDNVGIASYSDNPSIDYPISPMTGTNKSAAKAAINALGAGGSTNIGGGLQTALDMILGEGDPVSNEVIVLLSDGLHNTGTEPAAVLPAIQNRNVTVYTIGVGGDVDASLLSNIASTTGGSYAFAADAQQLQSHFEKIYQQVRKNGEIVELKSTPTTPLVVAAGQSASSVVELDSYTERGGEATFFLSWDTGDLDLTLIRPDQTTVNDTDADVAMHVKGTNSELYRMKDPAAGSWAVTVTSASGAEHYNLQVHSSAYSGVFVSPSADKGTYHLGERILAHTLVSAPPTGKNWGATDNVANVEVTAVVSLDNVEQATFTLYDDGSELHGDAAANDGIYSNYFEPGSVGNYTFDVVAVNQSGFIPTGEPITMATGSIREQIPQECANCVQQPVAPFTRRNEFTVVVVPSALPDLIVQDIIATESGIEVIIKNIGPGPVLPEQDFWVDVYIDPTTPPTGVNDVWEFMGGTGLVWGITALPVLQGGTVMEPGETISLFFDSPHYWSSLSNFPAVIPAGTAIYAQVDSANANTDYGGVLEVHESVGGVYNNIFGPVIAQKVGATNTQSINLYLPLIASSTQFSAVNNEETSVRSSGVEIALPSRP